MAEIVGYIGVLIIVLIGVYLYVRERKIRNRELRKSVQLQEELEKRVEELKILNKEQIQSKSLEKFYSMGRVAATFAHELKNPLTNIDLSVRELAERKRPEENALLEVISRNSHKIDDLINNFLNVTIFTELSLENMSINEVLEEILMELSDRITLEQIDVKTNFDKDICEVAIDAKKIKTAFTNIISNAIDAMEKGGMLRIQTKDENNKCIVIIEDNGHGMNSKIMTQIFDPYFSHKTQKGSGLGLSHAQNIIFNHGGTIEVTSTEGQGTRFTVALEFA